MLEFVYVTASNINAPKLSCSFRTSCARLKQMEVKRNQTGQNHRSSTSTSPVWSMRDASNDQDLSSVNTFNLHQQNENPSKRPQPLLRHTRRVPTRNRQRHARSPNGHPATRRPPHQSLDYKPEFTAVTDVAQVIYLDHRGNGRSDDGPPALWTLAQWADDLVAFCDALGVVKPVVYSARLAA
jgi:hypothetical protein